MHGRYGTPPPPTPSSTGKATSATPNAGGPGRPWCAAANAGGAGRRWCAANAGAGGGAGGGALGSCVRYVSPLLGMPLPLTLPVCLAVPLHTTVYARGPLCIAAHTASQWPQCQCKGRKSYTSPGGRQDWTASTSLPSAMHKPHSQCSHQMLKFGGTLRGSPCIVYPPSTTSADKAEPHTRQTKAQAAAKTGGRRHTDKSGCGRSLP